MKDFNVEIRINTLLFFQAKLKSPTFEFKQDKKCQFHQDSGMELLLLQPEISPGKALFAIPPFGPREENGKAKNGHVMNTAEENCLV